MTERPFSPSQRGGVSARIVRIAVALAIAIALVSIAHVARAADSAWLDVESRIQYAFYTEDARALNDIAEQLVRAEGPQDALKDYYAGLANYRLALLFSTQNKVLARDAVERCASNLDRAVKAQAEFAAGLALQSACLRTLAALKPWSPLANSKSAGQMEKAVKLAPRDPRVLLLEALDNNAGANIDEPSLAKLKKATAAFEAERQGMDRTPGWGAAEAYTYLGRGYLDRGDVLAARDALERALLIAPDFALARRLMLKITSG